MTTCEGPTTKCSHHTDLADCRRHWHIQQSYPREARLCCFCAGRRMGGSSFHGLCTDPFGDKQECYCFKTNSLHRDQHELWQPSFSPEEDPEHDGGRGSRRVIDRWEMENEMIEERLNR